MVTLWHNSIFRYVPKYLLASKLNVTNADLPLKLDIRPDFFITIVYNVIHKSLCFRRMKSKKETRIRRRKIRRTSGCSKKRYGTDPGR